MPVMFFFILYALFEIGLFVVVGGEIGVLGVIGLVLGTAILGVAIMRGRFARAGGLLRAGVAPESLLTQGAMTGFGAVLLIMPGFLSDIVGLLFLLPPVQAMIARRITPQNISAGWDTTIIDADYVVDDTETSSSDLEPTDWEAPRRRLDRPRRD